MNVNKISDWISFIRKVRDLNLDNKELIPYLEVELCKLLVPYQILYHDWEEKIYFKTPILTLLISDKGLDKVFFKKNMHKIKPKTFDFFVPSQNVWSLLTPEAKKKIYEEIKRDLSSNEEDKEKQI